MQDNTKNKVTIKLVNSFDKVVKGLNNITYLKKAQVLAYQNSYEAIQIRLDSADCKNYSISFAFSNFINQNGDTILSDCFKVYAEKNIFVDKNWQKNGYPVGDYPDALIPIEEAIQYGENLLFANSSKVFYIEFFINSDVHPGLYKGDIYLTIENKQSIPMEIEVLDCAIPNTTRMKSLFHTNYEHMKRYERDGSYLMYDKYVKYLLEHRLCQTSFYIYDEKNPAKDFVEKALELKEMGLSTINIPTIEVLVDGFRTFDFEYLKNNLAKLVDASLEKNINLVKDATFYNWMIDEPFYSSFKNGEVEFNVNRFTKLVNELHIEYVKKASYKTVNGKKIIDSILKVRHVITDYYEKPYLIGNTKKDINGNDYQYPLESVALCPKFDGYDTLSLSKPYKKCVERWWYGCNTPNSPFPSYHIDDALYSPIMVSWLMAEHDIVGNLYWANNIYNEFNRTGMPLWLEDPYQTAHRGTGANGEGAILYPGATFDVDGPIGSLRLKAIRSGNQDYDLFIKAKEEYRRHHLSFDSIFKRILDSVRDGTKIDGYNQNFSLARKSLYEISALALSDMKGFITVKKKASNYIFTIQMAKKCRIYYKNKEIKPKDNNFVVSIPYQKDSFAFIKIVHDANTISLPLYVGLGLKVTLLEVAYKNNQVIGKTSLNGNDIRREISVDLEESKTFQIDLKEKINKCVSLGFELRVDSTDIAFIKVCGSQNILKKKLHKGWNRIFIPTNIKTKENVIEITLSKTKNVGFGDLYFQR